MNAAGQTGNHILIVEDNQDARDTLTELLRLYGYEVGSASNGQEALDYLRNGPLPAVILLDLTMPVMTGLQFLAERSLDPALATIPVVVISALADRTDVRTHLSGLTLLTKPVDIQLLLNVLSGYAR